MNLFSQVHSEAMYLNRKQLFFFYIFDHNYHNFKQILFCSLGQGVGQNKYTLKSKTKTVFYLNQIHFPPKYHCPA